MPTIVVEQRNVRGRHIAPQDISSAPTIDTSAQLLEEPSTISQLCKRQRIHQETTLKPMFVKQTLLGMSQYNTNQTRLAKWR